MTATSSAVSADPISVAVRSIHAMAAGVAADPPSCTTCAPSTARTRSSRCRPASWAGQLLLNRAVKGDARIALALDHQHIHHAIADGNLVALNSTMNRRHVAPWAVYTEAGTVTVTFPPTHKTFAMTQSHWFRIEDGKITEHWANRDDLGMARQLGWIPLDPAYLLEQAAVAKRRAKRH